METTIMCYLGFRFRVGMEKWIRTLLYKTPMKRYYQTCFEISTSGL